ncbi:hypothetical protein CAPTEDRAFT_141459, partial [Capitella teleta]
ADVCSEDQIRKLMTEAVMMTDLSHPHIMKLLGVAIEPDMGLPMLIMPFMAHKDLQSYLRGARMPDDENQPYSVDQKQKIVFAFQIARGMDYLHNQHYLHRDLASRNCLLDHQLRVYIADFGLIKDVYSQNHYQTEPGTKLPIRWMALEALCDRMFTKKSDVWSYGIVLWEIFSLGQIPYQTLDNEGILPYLNSGNRLSVPEACPPAIAELMQQCWDASPMKRPSFKRIVDVLDSLATVELSYVALEDTV